MNKFGPSHCKDMEPVFQKLAESASDQVIVGRVDLEKNLELAKRYLIVSRLLFVDSPRILLE